MPEQEVEFRLFFNNSASTPEQLERVEKITVEQEMDMAWEARIEMPLHVDEQGNWSDDDEVFMQPFARVRVEIRVGHRDFVPLIDGPIVGFDSSRSSEPGQSTVILIVQDDSIYLNREDMVTRFENQTDNEIAAQLFDQCSDRITQTDIDSTPSSGSALTSEVYQRGTQMQLLRSLARRQGVHAYVLPGDDPGQSIGVFRALPTTTNGLAPLVLLGAERNVESFTFRFNAQRPAQVSAASLRITDKEVISGSASYTDLDVLGDGSLTQTPSDLSTVILAPRQGESVDLDRATQARAISSSFGIQATGRTREDHYPDVLRPYNIVTLQGGNSPMSGDYLITRVTHTVTRSSYNQSFILKRNARTAVSGGSSSASAAASARGVF